MSYTKYIGRTGEDLVIKELLNKKFIVLGRNIHSRYGEIDILAVKAIKNTVTLIANEVKTVNEYSKYVGLANLHHFKIQKIANCVKWWISKYNIALSDNVNLLFYMWLVGLKGRISIEYRVLQSSNL